MTSSQLRKPQMSRFLRRHDLVCHTAPVAWDEGLPMANASMGAIVWGDGNPLKLTFSAYELWDLREPDFTDPRYSYANFRKLWREGRASEISDVFEFRRKAIVPTRLPGPRAELSFGSEPVRCQSRLNIFTATAQGRISFEKGSVAWHAWIAPDEDILIFRILPGKHPRADLRVGFEHLSKEARADLKRRGFRAPEKGATDEISWVYQAIPENGGYLTAWRQIPEKANGETILISLTKGNDRESLIEKAVLSLNSTKRRLATIRRQHLNEWRRFWDESFLMVPDPQLERLFYVEMYKLRCCSKPGKFPISLQGPWSIDGEMPEWHGDYHADLNVQQSYWPVYTANHLDCGEPLYTWVGKLMPRFKEECAKFFDCEGAFCPCTLGLNGERIYGYSTCEQWVGNGAWLAWHFWQHYLYSRDDDFLRRQAYPVMREFLNLYVNILEKHKDGLYHLPLSSSPEYYHDEPEAWGKDTSCDLALIRALAEVLLWCAKHLHVNESCADQWKDILHHLAPLPTLATMTPGLADEWEQTRLEKKMPQEQWLAYRAPNFIFEAPEAIFIMHDVPYAYSHHHMSHLMALYPLGLITVEGSKKEQRMIADSIKTLWHYGQGRWAGETFPWVSCIASRARMSEMARHMLKEYADHFITSNTFHVNGDFRQSGASAWTNRTVTLESGFAFAGALMEMLLQSWGEKIRVFPTVPEDWKDISFANLRAEGAFLVSAKRGEGEVLWVEIRSLKGLPCKLVNPFPSADVIFEDIDERKRGHVRGSVLTFSTRPSGTYRFYCRKPSRRNLEITPAQPAAIS